MCSLYRDFTGSKSIFSSEEIEIPTHNFPSPQVSRKELEDFIILLFFYREIVALPSGFHHKISSLKLGDYLYGFLDLIYIHLLYIVRMNKGNLRFYENSIFWCSIQSENIRPRSNTSMIIFSSKNMHCRFCHLISEV